MEFINIEFAQLFSLYADDLIVMAKLLTGSELTRAIAAHADLAASFVPPSSLSMLSMEPQYRHEDAGISSAGYGTVRYLAGRARDEFKLFVHNGLLYDLRGHPVTTTKKADSHGILTINEHFNMYAADVRKEGSHIRHSSFACGSPVWFPGVEEAENGALLMLTNHSGHYKPSYRYLGLALLFFDHCGVDLSRTRVVVRELNVDNLIHNNYTSFSAQTFLSIDTQTSETAFLHGIMNSIDDGIGKMQLALKILCTGELTDEILDAVGNGFSHKVKGASAAFSSYIIRKHNVQPSVILKELLLRGDPGIIEGVMDYLQFAVETTGWSHMEHESLFVNLRRELSGIQNIDPSIIERFHRLCEIYHEHRP